MNDRWLTTEQQRAWRSYIVGTTLLMDHLDRELREKHQLSLPEYEIMVRLSEAESRALRMAELADSVNYSRSRVTHTIARMEQAGLVERRQCADDGRGVFAVMTDTGFAKLVEAAPVHVESVRRALIDGASDEDLAAVRRVFSTVIDGLQDGRVDPLLTAEPTSSTRS
ncbi:MAG: MarR family transcriptional regulator [Nocardioidaceae bacterium]